MTEPSPWIKSEPPHSGEARQVSQRCTVGLGVSLLESYRCCASPAALRFGWDAGVGSTGFPPVLFLSEDIDGEQDSMRGYPYTLLNDEEEKKEAGRRVGLDFVLSSFCGSRKICDWATRQCEMKQNVRVKRATSDMFGQRADLCSFSGIFMLLLSQFAWLSR